MKKLNKHPRLYKKMANTLKKLITNKLVKLKMINGQNKNSLKSNSTNIIQHHFLKPGQTIQNKLQRGLNNNSVVNQINNNNDFSRIINVASFRKIPYNEFILRLTPYDYETYLKMIKMNYSCRLEVHITNIRPIKYILGVLLEKWKNIPKIEPRINLYLIPIRELWIPKDLIFFSINDSDRIYDIGDIYTAYGSPSTNILHMKYQWNEEKMNLNINNNLKNNELSLNNNLLNNNNLTINPIDSINDINGSEYKQDQRIIKALSKLETSNLLNRSHTTIYNNLNNNQINFFSNKAIKADESQDLFDLSDLKEIEMGSGVESPNKKNINITESINKNEEYPLFDEKYYPKYSEQDSILPFDTELLDPMELLGFDNNDKKSDNLSNTISNKVRTPSISKKIHLRHKKISFVNNVKPTESMINSTFVNKQGNSNVNKLRTGYNELFSNNNSNNINNGNNLAYTSNNNLSEVSSHINNSNHFGNNNQGGTGIFSNHSFINKNFDKDNNSNINKSQIINLENYSKNKDSKNKSINFKNNSNLEEDSKINKESNIYNNSKNDIKNNYSNDIASQRKKKKIKFINNVSKENVKELKEIQERQKSKNNSSFFDNLENKKNNTNTINNSNLIENKNNLIFNSSISFGKQNQSQNNQNLNVENKINKSIIKENNNKENRNFFSPVKNKELHSNIEDSPMFKNNNSNKKKVSINNNHSNNWHFTLGNGLTRLLANNNSNIGFGMNDTFMGQNTMNYNGFFDNPSFFKSNLNASNFFHIDNAYLNEDNQLSQMMLINRGEEKTQPQLINSSFIGNEGTKNPLVNLDNRNNNIINNNINNLNSNSNHSNHIEYSNNNASISMNLNNDNNIIDNNLILGLKNENKNDMNNNNQKDFLSKKRNISKEKKLKKNNKNNNSQANSSEKKSSKKNKNISNIKNNMGLKAPYFSDISNNMNNNRYGNRGINNNFKVNKTYNPPFPYNIDIPLPSQLFDESINNFKK